MKELISLTENELKNGQPLASAARAFLPPKFASLVTDQWVEESPEEACWKVFSQKIQTDEGTLNINMRLIRANNSDQVSFLKYITFTMDDLEPGHIIEGLSNRLGKQIYISPLQAAIINEEIAEEQKQRALIDDLRNTPAIENEFVEITNGKEAKAHVEEMFSEFEYHIVKRMKACEKDRIIIPFRTYPIKEVYLSPTNQLIVVYPNRRVPFQGIGSFYNQLDLFLDLMSLMDMIC